jgi:AraC-like DNA-binding protein
MMPVMSGIDLCVAIKQDINLCHIPVIFLTAKNDIDSKIMGLKVGAESYIEKPFSFEFLKNQILSLLNNRKKEREAFSKRPFFPVQNMQMSKEDEEFMNKVLNIINENISDESFNVERMAELLYMSRSSLLRKIKTLFGMSPLDFIRVIRLKRAAELIQEGKYRVGEICYMVGFSSHSYFSKLFCKQFGIMPKDFEKQVETERENTRNRDGITITDL